MKGTYYAISTEGIHKLGPFATIREAESAIRRDCMAYMRQEEDGSLSLGRDTSMFYGWTIFREVRRVKPVLVVAAKVTLGQAKDGKQG